MSAVDRKEVTRLARELLPSIVHELRGSTVEWCVEQSIKTAEKVVELYGNYESAGQEKPAKKEQDDSPPVKKTPAKKSSTKKTTK